VFATQTRSGHPRIGQKSQKCVAVAFRMRGAPTRSIPVNRSRPEIVMRDETAAAGRLAARAPGTARRVLSGANANDGRNS